MDTTRVNVESEKREEVRLFIPDLSLRVSQVILTPFLWRNRLQFWIGLVADVVPTAVPPFPSCLTIYRLLTRDQQ